MKLILVLFVFVVVYHSSHAALSTVKSGDCVCATTTVNARNAAGLSSSVVATMNSGDCGQIYGGILTKDGYKWFELTFNGQRVWAAGNYLNTASASSCSAVNVPGGCPRIIPRSGWGARPPSASSLAYLSHPLQYAFIHHAESNECYTQSSCASQVKGFQNYHMDHNGWGDIGYSFIIGGDSSVFEGRGWDLVGAHTYGYNSVGIGICFIGSFMTKEPTAIQIATAQQLINCGVSKGKVSRNYILRGHRDMSSTDCPGDRLYAMIQSWPHY